MKICWINRNVSFDKTFLWSPNRSFDQILKRLLFVSLSFQQVYRCKYLTINYFSSFQIGAYSIFILVIWMCQVNDHFNETYFDMTIRKYFYQVCNCRAVYDSLLWYEHNCATLKESCTKILVKEPMHLVWSVYMQSVLVWNKFCPFDILMLQCVCANKIYVAYLDENT